MDGTIVKGTTPTIQYIFNDINVSEIVAAYFTIRQSDVAVIEKGLTDADVDTETSSVSWTLDQEDTLQLYPGGTVIAFLDWVLENGTRGSGRIAKFMIAPTGKDEVISVE